MDMEGQHRHIQRLTYRVEAASDHLMMVHTVLKGRVGSIVLSVVIIRVLWTSSIRDH